MTSPRQPRPARHLHRRRLRRGRRPVMTYPLDSSARQSQPPGGASARCGDHARRPQSERERPFWAALPTSWEAVFATQMDHSAVRVVIRPRGDRVSPGSGAVCSAACRYRGVAPQPARACQPEQHVRRYGPHRARPSPLSRARQAWRRCPWRRRGARYAGGRRTPSRTLPYYVSTTIFPATRPSSMAVWASTI